MSVSSTVWWLLATLMFSGCWAAIANTKQNGLPLPDQEMGEAGDLVMQMPSCLEAKGVCAPRQNCQEEYIHMTSDLCGEQADIVCCLTRSAFEKHVLQLQSCVDTGSVCAFEEDCPEQDRHSNPLLCGDQEGVTCCQSLPINTPDPYPRKGSADKKSLELNFKPGSHTVQTESCEAQGGICRQEEQCETEDRLGSSDICGDQPYITCCRATDLDRPFPNKRNPQENMKRSAQSGRSLALSQSISDPHSRKRSGEEKSFELKYKRGSHTVQTESCEAQGGICRQEEQCETEDRLGSSDICGDQPYITCCRATDLDRPFPNKRNLKENVKRRAHSIQIGSQMNTLPILSRPNYLPATLCESNGGTCKQESQCLEQDRIGSSDMCADEPNFTCCLFSSRDPDLSNEIEKRNALSIQLDPCRAESGMCTYVTNCPAEDQLGVDKCGGLANITCCHLSFMESAIPPNDVQKEKSVEVVPKKRTDSHSNQIESCRAQGGMCRQTDQCPETDRLGSESCGDLPYITCCKKGNASTSSEASTRVVPNFNLKCLMRGGLCRRDDDCFPEDRYESANLCGGQAGVSCCKRLPPRVGECSARGGECVPESVCDNGPRDKFGQCSGGDVCCVWTRMGQQ